MTSRARRTRDRPDVRGVRPPAPSGEAESAPDASGIDEYCRAVEEYLCRRSGGYPTRIVGPSFELVRRWARSAIPLKVVYRGIDRYSDRRSGARPGDAGRRRAIKLEFCAADVVRAFEEWRRSGEPAAGPTPAGPAPSPVPPGDAAVALRRAIARLTGARAAAGSHPPAWDQALDAAVRDLDRRASALRDRSDADVEARLLAADRQLVDLARQLCPPADYEALRRRAATELEPFRARMPAAGYRAALESAIDTLLRQRYSIPRLSF